MTDDKLIVRILARMHSEMLNVKAEAWQREAEILARIDRQFARTAKRFRDQRAVTFAAEFAVWWLIGCSAFTVGTIGAAGGAA